MFIVHVSVGGNIIRVGIMCTVQFYRFKWWSMLPYRTIHGCLENAHLRITNNNNNNNDAKVTRVTVVVHALPDSLIVTTLHVGVTIRQLNWG